VLLSGHDWLPEDVLQPVDAFVAKGESPATLLATVRDLLTVRSPFFYALVEQLETPHGSQRFEAEP
jgi:hypothetical protein